MIVNMHVNLSLDPAPKKKSHDKCSLLDVAQTCLRNNKVKNAMDSQVSLVVDSENDTHMYSHLQKTTNWTFHVFYPPRLGRHKSRMCNRAAWLIATRSVLMAVKSGHEIWS